MYDVLKLKFITLLFGVVYYSNQVIFLTGYCTTKELSVFMN